LFRSGPQECLDHLLTLVCVIDNRRLFRATSVKLSSQAVELAQDVFDRESAKLSEVTNGSVTITYQYLSQAFVDAAYANGNSIEVKPADGPLIGISPFSQVLISLSTTISNTPCSDPAGCRLVVSI